MAPPNRKASPLAKDKKVETKNLALTIEKNIRVLWAKNPQKQIHKQNNLEEVKKGKIGQC